MKREEGIAVIEGKSLCKAIQMKTTVVVKCVLINLPISNNKIAIFLTMLNWFWMI